MHPQPNRWLVLATVILAFIPIVIDMTILHIAVPSLTAALGASGTETLWIIDIYSLMMAGLLVPMGTLADRVGHRPMMLIGLSAFTIASVMAAFSPAPLLLIAARALMAVGGSMIMPSILALIRQSFEDERERALGLGVWSAVASVGAALGPLAGGALLEHFWWGSVFLINLPVMLVVLPTAWFVLPRQPSKPLGPWNIQQALILIVGLIATAYAVKSGFMPTGEGVFGTLTLVLGVAMLVWFARIQRASATPMLDLSLFAAPVFSVGLLMAFVASGAMAGFELVLAQELQYVFGKTPLEAGLFLLPLAAASAAVSPFSGMLTERFGLRAVATASMGAAAASFFLLGRVSVDASPLVAAALLGLLGTALGCGLLASSVAIMSSAPTDKAGAAGSLEATGYELGAGLGVTFFGVLLGAAYHSHFSGAMGVLGMVPATAANSINDAMTAAQSIGGAEGDAIVATATRAFSSAHQTVLGAAASLLGALTILVFCALRHAPRPPAPQG